MYFKKKMHKLGNARIMPLNLITIYSSPVFLCIRFIGSIYQGHYIFFFNIFTGRSVWVGRMGFIDKKKIGWFQE
jgi:hypothetical protein